MAEKRQFDRDQRFYMAYDVGGIMNGCPYCTKPGIWHAFLFSDEPRQPDDREAVGEVFGHDGSEDCVGIREEA
jgi:hypothetical protein